MAKKVLMVAPTSALLVGGGMVPVAFAAGAGGGDFTCSLSGVPGWGTVTAKYKHNGVQHYATARGKGAQTTWAAPGLTAVAAVGRAVSGNTCNWGKG